jgi:predicted small secreted protein
MKTPFYIPLLALIALSLSGCGTVESAAQDDCTSIGWSIGSAGYEDCFRARVRERNMDYSRPSDLTPRPGLL